MSKYESVDRSLYRDMHNYQTVRVTPESVVEDLSMLLERRLGNNDACVSSTPKLSRRREAVTIGQMMLWSLWIGLLVVTGFLGIASIVYGGILLVIDPVDPWAFQVVIATLNIAWCLGLMVMMFTKKPRERFYARGEQRILDRMKSKMAED